jgi:hypothetical protein
LTCVRDFSLQQIRKTAEIVKILIFRLLKSHINLNNNSMRGFDWTDSPRCGKPASI